MASDRRSHDEAILQAIYETPLRATHEGLRFWIDLQVFIQDRNEPGLLNASRNNSSLLIGIRFEY